MNATEQRRHATLAQKVEQVSEDVTQVVDSIDARVFELARQIQEMRRQLNEFRVGAEAIFELERAARARLGTLRSEFDAFKSYQEMANTAIVHAFNDLSQRTFWGRMTWLLTGR